MSPVPIRLRPVQPGYAAPEDLIARRKLMDLAPQMFGSVRGVAIAEEVVGGVRCLRLRPAGKRRATLIYLHGGGFRLCTPENYVGFVSHVAAAAAVEVIAPDYRLAPENPFPAGLSDALAVFEALPNPDRSRLVLAGDSAGGGLTAGLARLVLSRGVCPLGILLYSAWLDLTVTAPSFDENAAHDPLFSRASASEAAEQYLQGQSPHEPLASPLFGDVSDFPPTLISVGMHEVLRDDSLVYGEALKAAGRQVELICTPHMQHVAPTRDPNLPGAAESMAATLAFLSRILD